MATGGSRSEHGEVVRADLARLLQDCFVAGTGEVREGDTVGLSIRPVARRTGGTIDVLVTVSPRYLVPPEEHERDADESALQAFRQELRDSDPFVRIAACDALGQLVGPGARAALEDVARGDPLVSVRSAAMRALTVLAAQRVGRRDLEGLALLVFQRADGHWLRRRLTVDASGQGWIRGAPAQAEYFMRVEGWLAGGVERRTVDTRSAFPQGASVALEGGTLTWRILRDRGGLVVDVHADASRLTGGGVFVSARASTGEVTQAFVPLGPAAAGVMEATHVVAEHVDPALSYTVSVEPICLTDAIVMATGDPPREVVDWKDLRGRNRTEQTAWIQPFLLRLIALGAAAQVARRRRIAQTSVVGRKGVPRHAGDTLDASVLDARGETVVDDSGRPRTLPVTVLRAEVDRERGLSVQLVFPAGPYCQPGGPVYDAQVSLQHESRCLRFAPVEIRAADARASDPHGVATLRVKLGVPVDLRALPLQALVVRVQPHAAPPESA